MKTTTTTARTMTTTITTTVGGSDDDVDYIENVAQQKKNRSFEHIHIHIHMDQRRDGFSLAERSNEKCIEMLLM